MHRRFATFSVLSLALTSPIHASELSAKEQLGFSLFFDKNLSINKDQSCADCHTPSMGWTGPITSINAHGSVYEGSISGRFGNRKPPSSAYATQSPVLHFEEEEEGEKLFIGGNFWDGRATGAKLGNPAADQALGPFLNPVEQALSHNACVVRRVCAADYPVTLATVWPGACDIAWPEKLDAACSKSGSLVTLSPQASAKAEQAYHYVGLAIAAFEASAMVNPFTSKFDYFLAGRVTLSAEEKLGMELYENKGQCAACHPLEPGAKGEPPLFTDYTFDNLGVPRNPENPWYRMPKDLNPDGERWVDLGLGGFLATQADYKQYANDNHGKHKVPTVRNVDRRPSEDFVKAYMHNGYFKTLKGVVNFYNTRDVKPACKNPLATEAQALAQNCWPAPEVAQNVNREELGDLGLSQREENAIVAFMKTLSDGYEPPPGVTVLTPGQR